MSNPTPVAGPAARELRETDTHGRAPARRADSPAEAEGRRTLSTAFVRLGAGELLAVELRDGRSITLRDVVMRPSDYCGVQVLGGSAGSKFCGGYGDIVAARTIGRPGPGAIDPATLNPAELGRGPTELE